jgi:CRISPR system Cascade subunit CasD
VRPSALQPSRSALLGLLAAALGLRRHDEAAQAALSRTLRFAILVERAGVPVTDYHTTQVAAPQRGRPARVRADQLRERRHALSTILSRRDYRCDALYDVAAWHEGGEVAFPLTRLAGALERPVFTLYLGRKSCPLALPLSPRVVEAENVLAALHGAPAAAVAVPGAWRETLLAAHLPGSTLGIFWEGDPGLGAETAQSRTVRRDDPVSSVRRVFRTRTEDFQAVGRLDSAEDSDAAQPASPIH